MWSGHQVKEAYPVSKFYLKRAANGVWYGLFTPLAHQGIKHGISTRLGGLSAPPFATFNLGIRTDDDPAVVRHNRQNFCQAVGVDFERVTCAQQVHSDQIFVVGEADAGRGATGYETAIPGTDALITDRPGLPLMLFFADCVPVLIFDPVRRAVGVSHAGWKGTVARIAAKTVQAMGERFGTAPADCLVGIGPSIGPCDYEVDDLVVDALKEAFGNWQDFVIPRGGKWMLDLWQTNRFQLEEIGVPRDRIEVSGVCTACNTTLFYSHRAEKGKTGRMGAVISL
jgi:YfiH family protein